MKKPYMCRTEREEEVGQIVFERKMVPHPFFLAIAKEEEKDQN